MSYRILDPNYVRRTSGKNGLSDQLEYLKFLRQDLAKNRERLPAWEYEDRETILKQERTRSRDGLHAAALGLFNTAVENLEGANYGIRKARAKEISRWDPTKLTAHSELVRQRIQTAASGSDNVLDGGPSIADQLNEIYQEAIDSDDRHIKRAASEVFKSALAQVPESTGPETRIVANRLQRQADRDLKDLRHTEEIDQAAANKTAAVDQLLKTRDTMVEIGQALGEDPASSFETTPIAYALRRLKVSGNDVTVLDRDDPQVTGVVWKQGTEVGE